MYEKALKLFLSPINHLPGCSQETAEKLTRLRIHTLWDLLRHYPKRYQDRSQIIPIDQIKDHKEVTIQAEVFSVRRYRVRFKRRYRTEISLRDQTGEIIAVYFAQASYYHKAFKRGNQVILFGRIGHYKGRLQLQQPEFEILNESSSPQSTGIFPIYAATEGLTQQTIRNLIQETLDHTKKYFFTTIPENIEKKRKLMSLRQAFLALHQPTNLNDLKRANERLDYEELFHMQLGLMSKKHRIQTKSKNKTIHLSQAVDQRIRKLLTFKLTQAQERVIQEIMTDFARSQPMNRLLQGDVGSGKTIVAVYSLLVKIAAGEQVVLMAPTEILAEQHYQTIKNMIPSAKFNMALLCGSTKESEKNKIKEGLANGSISLVIGTHALITSSVIFDNLTYVIIDEQHKFGVLQRADLSRKGTHPDILVMTATPIPRTLSLTLYGDLDVSVIDEMPPDRQKITTKKVHPNHRTRMNTTIKKEIKKGRQAYFIYPLVSESEKLDLQAATQGFEELKKSDFQEFNIGLLHGRMNTTQKEHVIKKLFNGDIDILVSTSVVEVGVNVPNATVMVIENAERFGLAQLHQLRGRIGRSQHASTCFLVANPKSEDSQLRIATLCQSQDGFKISEVDLEIRGAGDYFGTRQSGQPGSRIGRILHNLPLISKARQDAIDLLTNDPHIEQPEHLGCHYGYRLQFAYSLNLTSVA